MATEVEIIDTGWRDYVTSDGGDFHYVENIRTHSYNEFIKITRDEIRQVNGSDYLFDIDKERLAMTEDEFTALKAKIKVAYNEYISIKDELGKKDEEVVEAIKKGDLSKYKIPYKQIFNGVFPHLDKKKLTERDKKILNVDGLNDECYDIFVDTVYGLRIPVYYDFATTNQFVYDFVHYLKKYKESMRLTKMNYKAPLILFDRMLMGIDVESTGLTHEVRSRIVQEVINNPIYYFRECDRSSGADGTSYKWQPNMASWTVVWLYSQCFNIYHEAPRQTGKTHIVSHIMGYEFMIGSENAKMLIMHYDMTQGLKNKKEIVKAANAAPAYLRRHTAEYVPATKKKAAEWVTTDEMSETNSKIAKNELCGNMMRVVTAGKTEQSAGLAGRGDTNRFIFIDEVNFVLHIQAVLTAVLFSHSTARAMAQAAGKRHCIFFTSTPGQLSKKEGREMHSIIYNEYCMFDPQLFDYSYIDLSKYLKKNSSKSFFVVKYSYREMGFSEEWADARLRDSVNQLAFQTDVLQLWLDVDPQSIFSQEQIARCRDRSVKHDEQVFIYKKYNRFIYSPIRPNATFEETIRSYKNIGVGIDIAYGNAGLSDSSVMYAIDLRTGVPIFMFKSNELQLLDFAVLIMDFFTWMKKDIPDTRFILLPETDGVGQSLLQILRRDKIIEPMIFVQRRLWDKREELRTYKSTTKPGNTVDSYYQYGTNMKEVRKWLTNDLLFTLVEKYPQAFDFRDCFIELNTLERKREKIQAKPGFHDDVIIACLHAYSLIFKDEYRIALDTINSLIIDFRYIEDSPINAYIDAYHEAKEFTANNNRDGDISYTMDVARDVVTGEAYDVLHLYKIIDGERVEITDSKEIMKEAIKNADLFTAIGNMRRPKIQLNIWNGAMTKQNQTSPRELSINKSKVYNIEFGKGIGSRMF